MSIPSWLWIWAGIIVIIKIVNQIIALTRIKQLWSVKHLTWTDTTIPQQLTLDKKQWALFVASEYDIEKKESIISAKEQEIVLLKNELEKIKNNEHEYDKISKEIFSIKSSVQNVSITKGQSFNRDSTSGNAVISIVVDSADSISISELEELKQWLKIRLDTATIDVTQR